MTDLEKRADEYAIKVAEKNVMPKDCFAEHLIRQAYLDATKAETALLSQHILDLQKDKGNLTDRVRELKQQIEKMKCCINDLVHLGEFNEHTDEEYTNYQVHEALKNAEQFIRASEVEK